MKTNFTSFTGKGLLLLAFSFFFSASFSSNIKFDTSVFNNLTVSVVDNNIQVNWNMPADAAVNYCAVQASTDGKTFSTIGYVMGPNPKAGNNTYTFKQQLAKIKPGLTYYRVLNMGENENATASEVVKISK
ncbi:MAG: hypothetical protein U0V75_05670 [Ferruginibacter sp.]